MTVELSELLKFPEGEAFERKRALDPAKPDDMLGLIADLTAMANTRGGSVLIGEVGRAIPKAHLPLFDSARLDDKVNSFVEPRVCEISSAFLREEFVLIEVGKSQNPPHIFQRDGNFHDVQGKPRLIFRLGDIVARHSSKTEKAGRSDFDRWFEENRKRLFQNVKMVFEAGPTSHVQVTEREGPPVRIDASAPGAQPVYDLLTSDPFRNLDQELVGAIKSWKTSGQYPNELQILKAYSQRDKISDTEITELILRSCWEHRLPGYFWATRMHPSRLLTILEEVIAADRYPASAEALKVAALLPRTWVKPLLDNTTSSRRTVQSLRRKLEPALRARTRKHTALAHSLYRSQKIKYKGTESLKEVGVDAIDEQVFQELLSTLPAEIKDNRGPFRLAELLVYGAAVQDIRLDESGIPDDTSENGGQAGEIS